MMLENQIILFLLAITVQSQPNFVLVLTDDQDLLLDGMKPMKKTVEKVANKGVFFTNAHVHSPICCPSRSSVLTGQFLHNVQVFNNSIAGNCYGNHWKMISEPFTVANLLKKHANYSTFYAGKYLNQYAEKSIEKPVGYDWWYGLKGNSKYYDFTIIQNYTDRHYRNVYLTDLLKQFALDFLRFKDRSSPFFMIVAPPAPHAPFTAAPRHRDAFPGEKTKKTRSFNATGVDKHWLLNLPPEHLPSNVSILDDIQRNRMQTLLAVDELLDAILSELENTKEIDETYVIYTSDNGFHIGQFSQPWDKRQPYQTDVLVPLIFSGPGILAKKLIEKPVSLVDLAPTIIQLAGITPPETESNRFDGISLKDLLMKGESKANGFTNVFVEYFGEGNADSVEKQCGFDEISTHNLAECSLSNWCKCQDSTNNTYACVVQYAPDLQQHWKLCQFFDENSFHEAYNLREDPQELCNVYPKLPAEHLQYLRQVLNNFRTCKGYFCRKLRYL